MIRGAAHIFAERARPAKIIKADGTVVDTDTAAVLKALLERAEIEGQIEIGRAYISPATRERRAKGLPDLCENCGDALGMTKSSLKRRNHVPHPWHCKPCAARLMNPETRARTVAAMQAAQTPESLREAGYKAAAKFTLEEKRARVAKTNAKRAREERSRSAKVSNPKRLATRRERAAKAAA